MTSDELRCWECGAPPRPGEFAPGYRLDWDPTDLVRFTSWTEWTCPNGHVQCYRSDGTMLPDPSPFPNDPRLPASERKG